MINIETIIVVVIVGILYSFVAIVAPEQLGINDNIYEIQTEYER